MMLSTPSNAAANSAVTAFAALSGVVLAASTLYLNRSATKRSRSGSVSWDLPEWAAEYTTSEALKRVYRTDEEMMKVAVDLSRRNVEENTGGPFGSVIFERLADGTARIVSVGCNRVVPMNNSGLHGETVAIQIAQAQLGLYSLRAEGGNFELFTSCEPCCMCLGATLWSGVNRIVCAAAKGDASAIGFDEGPVFDESYDHLERAGVKVERNVLREAAAEVLSNYGKIGVIYNA
mmetsp:Transcript_19991/g.37297  ORF Transcript_19991/g.37297 Transcript_19991/m.37297 type:complete len:234 (+) Transcript_19991:225-926(+)|eukprot:CAMPEP_0182519956 /NCGR_PEP_ID=MMETSP1321-20130603/45362_1 /TAXON_ID=91990 /ORGANISM="Bolidomonas sp., Strain RCC1657" /LENGTH=233 /DNA_ID=CAMNT_0024727955 /DNA_START=172 /DNA_END=873 /DNA_ORIENTATION=+